MEKISALLEFTFDLWEITLLIVMMMLMINNNLFDKEKDNGKKIVKQNRAKKIGNASTDEQWVVNFLTKRASKPP